VYVRMYLVIIHQKNDFIEKTGRFLLEKEKQGSNKKKKVGSIEMDRSLQNQVISE